MRLHLLLAGAFALVWLGLPALGRASTFVVYAPGIDATTAAATAQAELGEADIRVAGPITDWIGVADDRPVVVGASGVIRCEDTRRPKPLKGYLVGIENAMADMSYRDALWNLETVIAKLPCLAEQAEQEDIYNLFVLQGVARYFEENRKSAEVAFRAAVAIAPGREWPKNLSPEPEKVYLAALRKVTATPPASLTIEIDDTVVHNGVPHDGSPRMLAGGHLLWMPKTRAGMFVTIPAREALPEQGVLVTTGGRLRAGLMAGEEKYAPWIEGVAEKEKWDDVVLVSEDGVVRYRNGEFTPLGTTGRRLAAKARRNARATKQLGPVPITGLATLGAGAALAGVGVGLNLFAYNSGVPKVGNALLDRAAYESKVRQNHVGLGLAIGGGATATAGAILALIGIATQSSGGVALAPWMIADPNAVAFGISGRLP